MSFAKPHFAEPQWLWLAGAATVLVVVLLRYATRARQRQLAMLASSQHLGDLTRSHSRLRRASKDILLLLAVVATGVALARPQWGVLELSGQSLGEDIVFVVDCSRSMLATDVSPSRLERAKVAVQDFVRRHGRGRVGLVAFAGQAFLQCPLTFDYGAFEDALRALDAKTIPVGGTDIGRALDEAFRAMEKADRRKVVVLVTDGEDLEKTGVRVAETVAEQGVVVFSVGVGTEAGAEIQFLNEQGQMDFVRDRSGQVVRSHLDEAALRKIAEVTKGGYFPLGPLGEGLTRIRRVVASADFTSGPAPVRRLGVDRYHIPIAIVLGLLVVESLIGTRRRMVTEER